MELYKAPFSSYKSCEFCGKPLPDTYKEDVCPACKDRQLFNEVKDFIREHDVNEYAVAEKFGIPLSQVKSWIREGRIEYKSRQAPTIAGAHCHHCGAPVNFGTLCPKCLKLLNGQKVYGKVYKSKDSNKMRYIDNNDEAK